MHLSIIIPTLNEEARIGPLVNYLKATKDSKNLEIIIADAHSSTDHTVAILSKEKQLKAFKVIATNRAKQMNAAAAKASGDALYFVHADTKPPHSFLSDIQTAFEDGYDFGYFCCRYDSSHPLLKWNSRFSGRKNIFTGGGDQTFFIKRSLFRYMGGFREDLGIMEDFDLFWRLRRRKKSFTIVPRAVTVSARKYEKNAYLKVSLVNLCTFTLFRMGYCPKKLKAFYSRVLS